MQESVNIRSPKRTPVTTGEGRFFDYYAGYSPEFVSDVLNYIGLKQGSIVLDPWNGAGTTTRTAAKLGFASIGFDLNPAMNVVARAKLFQGCSFDTTQRVKEVWLDQPRSISRDVDFLNKWFLPQSTEVLRGLELAIQSIFNSTDLTAYEGQGINVESISAEAAWAYTVLFKTVKRSLLPFRSSNPTWIKIPSALEDRLALGVEDLLGVFEQEALQTSLSHRPESIEYQPQIRVGSSTEIRLLDRTVDAVIASPPYCTRIDYVVATRPELAVLGLGADAIDTLRRAMIGTPTISRIDHSIDPRWGMQCSKFLKQVSQHPSKASGGYYLRTLTQYFRSIYRSLEEIDRILKGGGTCTLVVQDSYYKNIHNDLPTFYCDMASFLGWRLAHRSNFRNKSIVDINSRAKKYRPSSEINECVLIFEKQGRR